MMRIAIAAAGVVALAGCQPQSVDEMSYTELRAYAVELGTRCESQGVLRTSREFEACVRQEFRRDEAMRARSQQTRMAIAAALDDTAANMRSNQPVNCTSTRSGSYTYTNCY